MAESVYLKYIEKFGYPPKLPKHLQQFAKQNGSQLSWRDASTIIKNPPDSSNQNIDSTENDCKQPQTAYRTEDDNKQQILTGKVHYINDGSIWSKYIKQYGYEPSNASDLMLFTITNSTIKTINIIEATKQFNKYKNIVKNKIKTKKFKIKIKVNYCNNIYIIPINSSIENYTINELRNEVITKYINEPVLSLIFKLNSVPVCNYGKNLIEYYHSNDRKQIIFDVELINKDKQIVKSRKSVHERIIEEQGINVKKLTESIKQQFKTAYFTPNDENDNNEKKIDAKVDAENTGKWDTNLNDGISTMMSFKQNQMFKEVIQQFEGKIKGTINQHKELENKINNKNSVNNKTIIKQELNIIMNKRKNEISKQYENKLNEMKGKYKNMNDSWETIQTQILNKCNNNEEIQQKIVKERVKRIQYQQRQISNHKREYYKKQQEIDETHNNQETKLLSCNDTKDWYNIFVNDEIKKEKINTLNKMVENKIKATNSQITMAKHLHNSPFADNLRQEAQKLDHEITKIATLAGQPLVIDMINRNIDAYDDENNNENKDNEQVDEYADKYLEFELRFDDEYRNWNSTKQFNIKQSLSEVIGINSSDLEFIGSREGCIICRFKSKFKAIYKKAKDIGGAVVDAARGGFQYGINEMKKEVKDLSAEIMSDVTYASKIDQCIPFLQDRVQKFNEKYETEQTKKTMSKKALYLASKCVLIVISHYNENKDKQCESNVIDGDFLCDKIEKEKYKVIMDPKWDKEYGKDKQYWEGEIADGIDRGGYPYYCPSGWKRYGIRIDNFDETYKGWSVCYHGSQTQFMGSILSHGIFGTQDVEQRYFSPSIKYSSYGRYGAAQQMKNGKWIQTIFQCRINSDPTIMRTKYATSCGRKQIDTNFSLDCHKCECGGTINGSCPVDGHNEMEWYLEAPNLQQYVVYGIMVRISDNCPTGFD